MKERKGSKWINQLWRSIHKLHHVGDMLSVSSKACPKEAWVRDLLKGL